jgi:hypothetical protein
MSAATLRILARNIESVAFNREFANSTDPLTIQFSDFSIEYLHQTNRSRLDYARQFFKDAVFGECLIEREYESIPLKLGDYTGFGAIADEPEDLLLLLRLFHLGDLAFVAVSIEKSGHSAANLYPYRVISGLVGESTRQYRLEQTDVSAWESFAASLRASAAWRADWFKVSRRSFLYGGSKEFNPNFESEVDRVADYIASLEAALVPKSFLIQRCLKERAVRLLGLTEEKAQPTKKLLTKFYALRSTLVHGGSVKEQLSVLQDRDCWRDFEQLVRDLLVAALGKVPTNETARASYLASLYEPDDNARAEQVQENFKAIKDQKTRENLLAVLSESPR